MSAEPRFRLCNGVRVLRLNEAWAAFSPQSGETLLLNAESAAVLEVLAGGSADAEYVATTLAADTEVDVSLVADVLRHVWGPLSEAGLVEPALAHRHNLG